MQNCTNWFSVFNTKFKAKNAFVLQSSRAACFSDTVLKAIANTVLCDSNISSSFNITYEYPTNETHRLETEIYGGFDGHVLKDLNLVICRYDASDAQELVRLMNKFAEKIAGKPLSDENALRDQVKKIALAAFREIKPKLPRSKVISIEPYSFLLDFTLTFDRPYSIDTLRCICAEISWRMPSFESWSFREGDDNKTITIRLETSNNFKVENDDNDVSIERMNRNKFCAAIAAYIVHEMNAGDVADVKLEFDSLQTPLPASFKKFFNSKEQAHIKELDLREKATYEEMLKYVNKNSSVAEYVLNEASMTGKKCVVIGESNSEFLASCS